MQASLDSFYGDADEDIESPDMSFILGKACKAGAEGGKLLSGHSQGLASSPGSQICTIIQLSCIGATPLYTLPPSLSKS